MKPATLFVGRWAPFHEGHATIINACVDNGKPVVIYVRDTPAEMDKWSGWKRAKAIITYYEKRLGGDFHAKFRSEWDMRLEGKYTGHTPITIIVGPDLDTVAIGRDVGYGIVQVPEEITKVSGTGIRQGNHDGMIPEVMAVLEGGEG